MPRTQSNNQQQPKSPSRRRRRSRRNELPGPNFQDIMRMLNQYANQTRSGRKPNPADPRTVLDANLGRTLNGALAAQKILHPCGEYDIKPVKIPDGAVSTSIVLERRDEFEVRSPSNATDKSVSWSCLVVHQPFLNHRDLVLRWISDVVPTERDLFNIITCINVANYTGTTPDAALYPSFQPASSLTGIIASTVTDTLQYSILTPATLTPALLTSDVSHSGLYKDIRRTACGYTTDLDASELYNQGRVVSGQWTPSVTQGTYDQTAVVSVPPGGGTTPSDRVVVVNAYDTWDYTLPAVTSTTIVASDLFCRQAEAKYGSYMPIRVCASDVCFTAASALRQIRSLIPGRSTTGPDIVDFTQRAANDIYLCGWSVATELWMNLDLHAQLRIKVIEDLELDPSPSSTYSPFMTPGYSKDDQALAVIREFARVSPHAYDSDFNRLNKMFTNLIKGLGGVLSNLGIPIVSTIAKPLAGAITDRWGYQASGKPPDQGKSQT